MQLFITMAVGVEQTDLDKEFLPASLRCIMELYYPIMTNKTGGIRLKKNCIRYGFFRSIL